MKFIQARWYTSGGNDHPTRIVMHDAEYPEKPTGAVDVANYFAHLDREASAHYVCDNTETVQCVKAGDIAYHAPPNAHSIGIELCGYSSQTTPDWLDEYGVAMLRDQAAPLVRDIAATNGIPLVWLSVQDLLDGKHGVTSHNNVSLAWHQSTHTDPGGNFPIDQFMAWARGSDPQPTPPPPQEDDDMPYIANPVTDNDPGEFLVSGNTMVALGSQDEAQQFHNSGLQTKDFEPLAWKLLKATLTEIPHP